MNGSLAHKLDLCDIKYERIGGIVTAMSRPSLSHIDAAAKIWAIFMRFLKGKQCKAFLEPDLFLENDANEFDNVIPDVVIVCDKDKLRPNGIYGAPDLIVEVLSPTTSKRDRQIKMELYQRNGVKEYWLVNPASKEIEVYALDNDKYRLHDLVTIIPDYTLDRMNEEERNSVTTVLKSPAFPGMEADLMEIFEDDIA